MKRRNEFIQSEVYSCGACCIESLVNYYGGYVPHETVLIDTLTDTHGTNAFNMINALKKYGFNAQGLKVDVNHLGSIYLPVIAHTIDMGYEHFVVIYKVTKDTFIIMNPRVGYKKYSFTEFKNMFDGIIIEVKPISRIVTYSKNKKLRSIFSDIFHNKTKSIIILFILNLIFIVLNLVFSFFFKALEKSNRIINMILIFLMIGTIKYIVFLIKDVHKRKLAIKIDRENNQMFFNNYFNLDYQYIMNKRSGEIFKKANDLSIVKELFLCLFSDTLMDIILFIISFIFLFRMSGYLGIISVTSIIIISLLFLIFNKSIYYREKEYNDEKNIYHGDFIEYTDSIESIRNIRKENYISNKIYSSFNKMIKSKFKLDNIEMWVNTIRYYILDSFYIVIMGLGMNLVNKGVLTFMDILVFNAIYSLTLSSLNNILNFIYYYISNKVVIRSINEFRMLKSNNRVKLNKPIYKIDIKNLCVSFDTVHNIISNFNYTINKGDKTLIIGSSGVGKSSLAKCISGLINSYSGEILINDKKNVLAESIIYVGQKEAVYSGTIKDNIILDNNVNVALEDICKWCCIDQATMLDKYIVNNGENISKGEKARIVLARALYLKPEVLIIDEVLSNVSEEMENYILRNLLKEKELTLIYITHRDKRSYFKKIINLERKDLIEVR